jgi:parvulin-like peptidyl-prolyl isomerase
MFCGDGFATTTRKLLVVVTLLVACRKTNATNGASPPQAPPQENSSSGLTAIAIVNGQTLSAKVQPGISAEQKESFARQEAYRFAVLQRAAAAGIELTADEIAEERATEPKPAQLTEYLSREGKTLEDFYREQNQIALIQKMERREVFSKIEISEEQINAEFDKDRQLYALDRARVKLLFIPKAAGATLNDEAVRARKGVFETWSVKLGGDTAILDVGRAGEIYNIVASPKTTMHSLLGPALQVDDDVRQRLFDGPSGATYGPIETGPELAWIYVEGRRRGRDVTVADVRPQIEAKLESDAGAKVMVAWMERVLEQANVKILAF